MKAYRIYLIGTNETYLITAKQKETFESIIEGAGNSFVKLGDASFRAREVKRIAAVNVDLESCPEYFQEAVEREKKGAPAKPSFQNLPTEWIIVNKKGHILATDVAEATVGKIARAILRLGDPEKDLNLRFVMAKCHYTLGTDGQRQYYTAIEQIPEALICFPWAEYPEHCVIRGIYRYGTKVK